MLENNRELVDQFNKEEQKRQCLKRKRLKRRTCRPGASKRLHQMMDQLDEALERRKPADCISKKWIE